MIKSYDINELYNIVYENILVQNKPCIGGSYNSHMYYIPSGAKCSIGHVLTDEALELVKFARVDVKGVETILKHNGFDSIPTEIMLFLKSIQYIHDSNSHLRRDFISKFKYDMANLKLKIENGCFDPN